MKRGLKIDPLDNVGIVLEHVEPGDEVVFGEEIVTALQSIDLPHKMALKDIAVGKAYSNMAIPSDMQPSRLPVASIFTYTISIRKS